MSTQYVGDTVTDTFTIIDNQNDPVPGLGWQAEVNTKPSGVPISYSISDLGNGAYRIAYVADEVGDYYLQLVSTTPVDGVVRRIGSTANVDSLTTPVTPISLGAVGTTLAEIIRLTAGRLHDVWEGTATAGSTNTITDEMNFVEADNHFRGSELYFVGGSPANVGLTRRAIASDFASFTITFNPSTPVPVAAGDRVEIYNVKGGSGFRRVDYKRAINDAIVSARPANDILIQQTVEAAFDINAGTVAIPDVFDSICNVQFMDYDGKWIDVGAGRYNHADGWVANPATREVTIGGWFGQAITGRNIRLVGYAQHPTVNADTEVIQNDPEWVIAIASHRLIASRRRPEDYGLTGQLKNDADVVRAKMAARVRLPNNVRLR